MTYTVVWKRYTEGIALLGVHEHRAMCNTDVGTADRGVVPRSRSAARPMCCNYDCAVHTLNSNSSPCLAFSPNIYPVLSRKQARHKGDLRIANHKTLLTKVLHTRIIFDSLELESTTVF